MISPRRAGPCPARAPLWNVFGSRFMIRHSAALLAPLLALVLLWAPLPFGGVTPWAGALQAALCFAALALAAVAAESARTWRPAALPAAALAAIALLGLLQAAPLPAGLVAALSPAHAALERQAAELGRGRAGPARLTLAAAATRGRRSAGRRRRRPCSPRRSPAAARAPALAGRGGARRRAVPGLLRRPRLVRPRPHALGGRPARHRRPPARHLRQSQPPRGLPGDGAAGRLRLELVGGPPRRATSPASSAVCCWPRRR